VKQQLKALCHTDDPTERVDLGAGRRGGREGGVDRVANAGNRGDPTHLADPPGRPTWPTHLADPHESGCGCGDEAAAVER